MDSVLGDMGTIFGLRFSLLDLAGRVHAQGRPQAPIEQVTWHNVLQGRHHDGLRPRTISLDVIEETRDGFSLQALLRAAKVAGEDRELSELREGSDVLLGAIREGPHDHVLPVVGKELRGHRRELAREEEVEEQRLKNVVPVVAKGDLPAAKLRGHAVKNSAAQARTQGTVRLPSRDLVGDD